MFRRIRRLWWLWGAILSMGACDVASAAPGDFSLYGEAALRSRFVDDDLIVYTAGPVVQPNLGVQHEDSGCFLDAWANVGLTRSEGDEIDLTFGCEREVAEGLSLNANVAHYEFLGHDQSMLALSAGARYGDFALQAYYFHPNTEGEADGARIVGTYSRRIAPDWTLEGTLAFDSGPYDGVPSILAGGAAVEYAVSEHFSLAAAGLVPLIRERGDDRGAQFLVSAILRF